MEKNKIIGMANNIISSAVNKAYNIKTGATNAPKSIQTIVDIAIDSDFDLDR